MKQTLFYTIIVPIYNAEAYLDRCLSSMLKQWLQPAQYEVIMVNDGSMDKSPSVCEEYAQRYHHFYLVNQSHQGVAAARNRGIERAKGRFLCFVDADDYLLDGALSYLYEQYVDRSDVQLIHFDYSYNKQERKAEKGEEIFYGSVVDYVEKYGLPFGCWTHLYRTDYIQSHNIRFKPYKVGEDGLFSTEVLLSAPPHDNGLKISYTGIYVYHHTLAEKSLTTTFGADRSRRVVTDWMQGFHERMMCINRLKRDFPDAYISALKSVNDEKFHPVRHALAAGYQWREFRNVKEEMRRTGFYPMLNFASSWKSKLLVYGVNMALCNYLFYAVAKWTLQTLGRCFSPKGKY